MTTKKKRKKVARKVAEELGVPGEVGEAVESVIEGIGSLLGGSGGDNGSSGGGSNDGGFGGGDFGGGGSSSSY